MNDNQQDLQQMNTLKAGFLTESQNSKMNHLFCLLRR